MEDTPVITEAAPSSAAPSGADVNSQPGNSGTLSIDQIDTGNISLDDLDRLMTGGNVEIPLKQPGGEGKAPAPAPAAPAAAAPTGEQPSVPAAPAVIPEGQEPVVETQEVVETRSQEEIDTAMQAARDLAASQGADEAVQQAAAEAAAQPIPPAVEPAAPAHPINRPRLDEREQLIMGVYQNAKRSGKPITLAEAEARVDGPKQEPVQVEPPVDLGKVVTDLKGELITVNQELDAAGDQLSNAELRKLQLKASSLDTRIQLAERDLKDATERAHELRAQGQQKSQAQRDSAYDQALQLYPDAADDSTPLGAAIAERVEAMKDPFHPDHKILEADSAPLTVARLVAAEMGVAPKQKAAPAKVPAAPPAKAPPVVAPPPRQVMSPAPGNKTAVQPAQPAEDAKAQYDRVMKEGTLEELDAIQGGDPTKALASLLR